MTFLSLTLGPVAGVGAGGGLHAVAPEDLEQLVSHGGDVLLDLVQVVLCHPFCLVGARTLHDVALYQVTHHGLGEIMIHASH